MELHCWELSLMLDGASDCPLERLVGEGLSVTVCLRKKVPAKVVLEMLGLSGIDVALDPYGHVLPDMQCESAAATGAARWAQEGLFVIAVGSRRAGLRDL